MERSFRPEFCRSPKSRQHLDPSGWRWIRRGSDTRSCEPRIDPRFRRCHCGVGFGSPTFSPTDDLERPQILPEISDRLLTCSPRLVRAF